LGGKVVVVDEVAEVEVGALSLSCATNFPMFVSSK
jgi:hypothetical protein